MRNCVDMSTLMLPAATMTTMTNTAPIAVAQPKADPVKGTLLGNNNNNTSSNKQGRIEMKTVRVVCRVVELLTNHRRSFHNHNHGEGPYLTPV